MTSAPSPVQAELDAAREATARLLTTADGLSPVELTGPSLLPGWTRAHVLAHVAGNALSHVRMLTGAQRGELLEQYVGGTAGRAADIDRLAADPPAAVETLHLAAAELETTWLGMGEQDWELPVQPGGRRARPAARLAWARWREVEVHHVDLAAGYAPGDWPGPFVDRLLEELLARDDLPSLAGIHGPPAELAAWLSGRSRGERLTGPLPDLPEWA